MKYKEFERIISEERMSRYVQACGGDTRKAMTLYRYNVELAQTVFAIVGYFEVALRNAIDNHLTARLGSEWLKNSIMAGGLFCNPATQKEFNDIDHAYRKLSADGSYSHTKLLACMGFGFWKYRFSPLQYRMMGRSLLSVFPNKPRSTARQQYNHSYIFNELDKINTLRNRIAHHEPICFYTQRDEIHTDHIRNTYHRITSLLNWMGISAPDYLWGVDHIEQVCEKIDKLKP